METSKGSKITASMVKRSHAGPPFTFWGKIAYSTPMAMRAAIAPQCGGIIAILVLALETLAPFWSFILIVTPFPPCKIVTLHNLSRDIVEVREHCDIIVLTTGELRNGSFRWGEE